MVTPRLSTRHRFSTFAFWALKIVLSLLGFGAAIVNLAGLARTVAEFDLIGFGQWFRYVTGLWLLVGSFLLIAPTTTAIGAILLCAVCAGAFFAQLLVLHDDVIHTLVPAAVFAAIAIFRRDQLASLIERRPASEAGRERRQS